MHRLGFSTSYMLTTSSVFLVVLTCSCSAARFISNFVRLVGQEPAPSKCFLLSTSREVRKDMKALGSFPRWRTNGLLNLMSVIWAGIWTLLFVGGLRLLAARVCLVISRLVLIFVLPP